jgi:hypothetical protein
MDSRPPWRILTRGVNVPEDGLPHAHRYIHARTKGGLNGLTKACRRSLCRLNEFRTPRIRRGPYMYEMQGPRPVGRCWLTDCSAARHCLTDHCYQIPVQDAGCPAAQPFRSCPQERYPVQIPVRSAGCPAPQPFPEIIPRDRIRSRYPSEAPVARLLSRFRSFPRNRYLLPGARPRRRLPSFPAVSGVSPGIGTRFPDTRPEFRLPGFPAVLGVSPGSGTRL